MATADRLREGVDFLARDFLGDVVGAGARGEAAVLGLFTDQQGGGADGQFVQLAGGGTVVQAGNGAGGHAHRIHGVQAFGGTLHRTILFRSTSSVVPLRLVTLIALAVGGDVNRNSLSFSMVALDSVLTACVLLA